LTIENHDDRTVSVPPTAVLTTAGGTAPLTIDLAGTCGATKADACRPLAPGGALWMSSLAYRAGDGGCTPVPPGQYSLQLRECPDGATITAKLDLSQWVDGSD